MYLHAGNIRSRAFIAACERLLVQRMAQGYELIGLNLVKPPFVEAQERCVIESALEKGLIERVLAKPAVYRLL